MVFLAQTQSEYAEHHHEITDQFLDREAWRYVVHEGNARDAKMAAIRHVDRLAFVVREQIDLMPLVRQHVEHLQRRDRGSPMLKERLRC